MPKASRTPVDRYLIKTLNAQIILFKTVFYIPFLTSLLASLCLPPSTPLYPVFVVLGSIGLLLFIMFSLVLNIFYAPMSPFDPHPMACFEPYPDMVKNSFKTIIPLYYCLDTTFSSGSQFLISFCVLLILWCFATLKLHHPYKGVLRVLYTNTPFSSLWIALCSAIQSFIRLEAEGLYYTLMALPLAILAWRFVLSKMKKGTLACWKN